MNYKRLGTSGLQVSEVGLGVNNFGGRCTLEQSKAVVKKALDLGITMFDTADVYPPVPGAQGKSEEFLGKALGRKRKDVVVATKFGMPMGDGPYMRGGSRRHIMNAVEASLKRLNTDYIDLYQVHQPDPNTPIEETLGALDDLVRAGKVRYIGCSNLTGWQVANAEWTARANNTAHFVSAQNYYNLLKRQIEADLVPACNHFGLGILPFFPLASGMLTGKYIRGKAPGKNTRMATMQMLADLEMTERNFDVVEKLAAYGESRGLSVLQIAMSWLVAQPHVSSVIAGATKPTQVAQNVKAAQAKLTDEDMAAIDKITDPSGGLPW